MNKLKCVIVDDEELARELLKTYVGNTEHLQLAAMFESPLEAMSFLKKEAVDLLFLDIQMPDLKGTDLATLVPKETRIIFTTAYSEYALQGFELNALDYLVKPITFKRFLSAINKLPQEKIVETDHLIIKSGYDLHKVLFNDIIYIESDSEYVVYHIQNGKKLMANQSLTKLEKTLPSSMFMRVHRSYIVNKQKVTGLKGRDLAVDTFEVPVSDSYIEQLKNELFKL